MDEVLKQELTQESRRPLRRLGKKLPKMNPPSGFCEYIERRVEVCSRSTHHQ
jgi:hypothetical protein